jgi:membrane protein YdbS with pleckstrin-like domain
MRDRKVHQVMLQVAVVDAVPAIATLVVLAWIGPLPAGWLIALAVVMALGTLYHVGRVRRRLRGR